MADGRYIKARHNFIMLRIFKQYYPVRNLFFVIGEGLAIVASVILASWILLESESFQLNRWYYFKIFLIAFVCQICLYYNDLYDFKVTDSFLEFGIRLFQAIGVAAILLAGIYLIFPVAIIGRHVFIVSAGFVILLIVSWRVCYKIVLKYGVFDEKIILLGSGDLAQNILNEIDDNKDCGYKIAVNVQEGQNSPEYLDKNSSAATIFKTGFDGLCDMAKELKIGRIVVALAEKRGTFPTKELLKCRVGGIDIIEGTSFYEMLAGKLIVEQINPGWLIFSEGFSKSRLKHFFKRATDLVLSVVLLILFAPVVIIAAILIKIDSKGPVFFSQERVGKNKKTYMVYKFRSMVAEAEKQSGPVWAKDNDKRVTRVGKVIRKWRVDETPQLWNVLKGEMSFVGPRPEREFFVKKLEGVIPYFGERFSVKPGITGWAQISYGYGASVEDAVEKLNYDLFYIKNMSIFMDFMIVLKTIKIVLFGKGAR
jgi:sugar transferase (PEP-CTERM system associated)